MVNSFDLKYTSKFARILVLLQSQYRTLTLPNFGGGGGGGGWGARRSLVINPESVKSSL